MKLAKLSDMTGGWFVGDFDPVIAHTKEFETAIKHYKKGQNEAKHYHVRGTEITVIVKGRARMMDTEVSSGDIVLLEPGEATGFEVLEDTITCVVKFPSLTNDKFIVES